MGGFLIEEGHQPVVNNRVHDPVDLRVHELHLGLRFEARIRQLDAQDANQTFPDIVAGNGGVLVFQKAVRLGVLVDGLGQRGAEARQVRSAVGIRDRVGERENLIVVAVVILEDDIDKYFVALPRKHDRLRVNDLFVFAQLFYELFNPVFVEERFLLRCVAALVGQRDFETRDSERRVRASATPSRSNLNSVVIVKIVGSGTKVMSVPVVFLLLDFADDFEFLRGFPALEAHGVNFSVARNLDLEPIGKRVDAFRADAVQTAGVFVSALPEFSAGMQIRQDQLDGRHLEFRMHVDRNAAAVVTNGNRAIHMDGHFDLGAVTGEMFVDRVVENFENHVMQTALIRVADIHSGTLSDSLQSLEFVDLSGVVFLAGGDAGGCVVG